MSQNAERCQRCLTDDVTEWIPPVYCAGRILIGTGVWRTGLMEGLCLKCREFIQRERERRRQDLALQLRLATMGYGPRPYREFHFDTFDVTAENERALHCARSFRPEEDNLYLWGACGVGKTHLAFAAARPFANKRPLEFLTPPRLMRSVRRRDPDDEQHAIDRIVRADVFVLDDLGIGNDTAFARQVFQEILDGRSYTYRAGLIVTSRYSLAALAVKLDDDTLTSRLAGMCRVIEMGGLDRRLVLRNNKKWQFCEKNRINTY